MLETIRELVIKLNEEIRYRESVIEHQKKFEATLWGLEEQTSFPENSSSENQTELSKETNNCRFRILNCNKLLAAHDLRLKQILKEYSEFTCEGCK